MPSGCTSLFIVLYMCVCMYVSTHTLESKKNAPNFSVVVQSNEYKPM